MRHLVPRPSFAPPRPSPLSGAAAKLSVRPATPSYPPAARQALLTFLSAASAPRMAAFWLVSVLWALRTDCEEERGQ